MKLNKLLIAPIVGLFMLFIKSFTGVQFDNETTDMITEAVLSILILSGIFMNPDQKNNGE